MVATISSSSLSASTTLNLSVTNPAPGGGTSATAQLVVSNGAPTGGSDVPGLIQAHLSDPDAFVLVGGVVGSSASQSAGLTTRPHVLLGPFDATSTTPSCTKGGPTGGFEANGGVCVAGVSWMPQVPPIDPSDGINYQDVWNNKTANCGEASLAIVKAQLQGLEPSPTDILDINNYIIENSVKFPDCPGTMNSIYGRVSGCSSSDKGGVGLDWLAKIATELYNFNTQHYSGFPSRSSALGFLQERLQNNQPVIVHVYYKLNVDPSVQNHGHYMIVVGLAGTSDSDDVYVVDPGRCGCNKTGNWQPDPEDVIYASYANETDVNNATNEPGIVHYTVKNIIGFLGKQCEIRFACGLSPRGYPPHRESCSRRWPDFRQLV